MTRRRRCAARPGPRAIWIWEGESYALLEDDAAARYRALIRRMHAAGLKVQALRKVSFHDLREGDMERELAETARAVAGAPAFGGFAIHRYAAYRTWLGLD